MSETETTVAETTETPATDAAAEVESAARNRRKVREGTVTSASMDKTIVVTVTDRVRHAKYNKFVLRTTKLYTHDESNEAGLGDKVRVMETRPLSKNKRWRLVEIIERAR
ncbi:MAG: 30S ribosomal protein S17 [Ilumatobacter sp.]|uniref:30S ribosomal protein S17 n=1 Tax=Ilumatobacter sp. TaxID=1967498 RepID=UPI00260E8C56|nr:30S ribosomal protein S17 [Ilumatobacter sp.]MDJ0771035.1 30S ribosomal protein S17 [Ilumatobacter sp.]